MLTNSDSGDDRERLTDYANDLADGEWDGIDAAFIDPLDRESAPDAWLSALVRAWRWLRARLS